jgi:hypothetical protein
MSAKRTLKILHIAGTAWFLLATGYLVIAGLRQAGLQWWVIYSLSGNGASLLFLFLSAYLYAFFGNSNRHPTRALEHPLTTSRQYMVLYSIVPFLGTAAGLCITADDSAGQSMVSIAMGTIGATFAFWIILDLAIGIIESLFPASRKLRAARMQAAKELREIREREKRQFLSAVDERQMGNEKRWCSVFHDDAKVLSSLTGRAINDHFAETKAVEIGLKAWQCGGLACMRAVRSMAAEMNKTNSRCADAISYWWDGIGSWRHKVAV